MPYDIIIGRDESDKVKFGTEGLIYIGKGYVKMGMTSSLSNRILMDVARSHVVLIAGKRGSGKCLHGDTLITLANGSQMPIKDIAENKDKVLSINENLKIEEAEKSEFFSRKVNKLLKLKLRSGKEIKLTPEHPLLTIKGWQEAQNLGIGSRIATPRKTGFGSEKMPEHEIKILAYLLAEGHLSNGFCLFSNYDHKIIDEFKESICFFDGNLKIDTHSKFGCFRVSQKNKSYKIKEFKRNSMGQFIDNNIIYEKSSIIKWLINLGIYGKLSAQKFVPEVITKLNKNQLSIFLNRLFSCDGSIYCKKTQTGKTWQISYCSSSEKMIRQVQNLLLKFEILSRLRGKTIKLNGKEFKSFELILNAENVLRFIEQVGFFGKKQEREVVAKEHILSVERNSNIDTIPKEIWELYQPANWAEVGRAFNYKHPKAMRERIHYSPTRQTLMQVAQASQNNPLLMLATSDIFWDEIVSMELLEGEFEVYDICVPKNHNFIANDIVIHNSYTLGVIAEELANIPENVANNIATVIFDTMGIFWTMAYENEKETELLKEWGIQPRKLPVRIFVPFGFAKQYEDMGIPVTHSFAIKTSELDADDWILTFGLDMLTPVSILIQRIINHLHEKKGEFDLDDILYSIKNDTEADKDAKAAATNLFEAAMTWGVFARKNEKGTAVKDLVEGGKTSIMDLSVYSSIGSFNVRALVIGLITKKLFQERMMSRKLEEIQSVQHGMEYLYYKEKRDMPLVWLLIDELHEFLPEKGKTPATDALVQLLREGRQPGLSLVGATQQPAKVHTDVWTQSDIVLSHRVTAKPDVEALGTIMQSYLTEGITGYMNNLPNLKGSAIILDDNSERIYPMRMRGRLTWHGGEAPTSVKIKKRV